MIQKVVRGFLQRGGTVDPAQVKDRLVEAGQLPESGSIDRRPVNEMGFHEIRGPNGEPSAFMQQDAVLKAATDTEPEQRGIRFVPNPADEIAPPHQKRGQFWQTSRTLEARGLGKSLISQQAIGSFQAPLSPEMLALLRRFKSFVVPDRVRIDSKISEMMQGNAQDHLKAGGAAFSKSDFKDLAKDLKGFHEAGGVHLDIHLGNVLVPLPPSAGLRLGDFEGAVFRNNITREVIIDFAKVDAETAEMQNDKGLGPHLREYGQAIDDFMLLKTIVSGLGHDDLDLDIDHLNRCALYERRGEDLDEGDEEDRVEAMVRVGDLIQRIAKPEHGDDTWQLVLDPIGFQQKYPDRLHLYDMLNWDLSPV